MFLSGIKTRVPKADGGQRNEAEIGGIEEGPLLPTGEHPGASEDVTHDQEDGQPDRHLQQINYSLAVI